MTQVPQLGDGSSRMETQVRLITVRPYFSYYTDVEFTGPETQRRFIRGRAHWRSGFSERASHAQIA